LANFLTLSKSHDLKSRGFLLISLISLVGIYLSKDPLIFLLGVAIFIFFLYLLFNRNLPPVILFSFFFQWLFLQGQLLDGLFKDESIITLDYFSTTKVDVTLLGFIGIFCFFSAMYLVIRKTPIVSSETFYKFFWSLNLTRLLVIYSIVYVALFIVGSFVWYFPGLSQPLYILTQFRWSMFFLLFCAVFIQNRFKGVLFFMILFDFAISFVSFFSSFKEVIYFSFLAYWFFFFRSTGFAKLSTLVIVIVTIYFGALWTAVKKDYRDFLNQGSGVQVILTSRSDAYSKLLQLAGNVNEKGIKRGFDELIDRLSIVGVFDAVYQRVPTKIPHEEGKLWIEGVRRPFMPRLLFPEKEALGDSKELNYYSNLHIDEENTSVSLSMMAGSYVDFGKWGMHVPLFLFGLFCGWVHMKAIKWGGNPIVGYALTMPMIYLLHINEESINRILSAIVLYLLVLWFIKFFLLNRFLNSITSNTSKRF
jgi:hypothetical protein